MRIVKKADVDRKDGINTKHNSLRLIRKRKRRANNKDTKQPVRKRSHKTNTRLFFPDETLANPYPYAAFFIRIIPKNGWTLAHVDGNGKTTIIAEKIPTRCLAEKALEWFKDGKYQAHKMRCIENLQLPTLIILSDWLRSLKKPHSANPS